VAVILNNTVTFLGSSEMNQSSKAVAISSICENAAMELMFCDTNEEANEIFDLAVDDVMILYTRRCLNPRQPIPKSDKWFMEVLPELDDNRFRHFLRVTRKDFGIILNQIESHDVFNGENYKKQFPISKQLAITLYKLGFDGSGSSLCNAAAMFGIGDGGTIMKVVSRVLKVIYDT